jgi:hypothetical protein
VRRRIGIRMSVVAQTIRASRRPLGKATVDRTSIRSERARPFPRENEIEHDPNCNEKNTACEIATRIAIQKSRWPLRSSTPMPSSVFVFQKGITASASTPMSCFKPLTSARRDVFRPIILLIAALALVIPRRPKDQATTENPLHIFGVKLHGNIPPSPR